MSRRLPEVDGVYLQMEDEIASMAAVIGASYSGVKSMTATSGPGFSLMQENIGLAAMTETPCVVVDVMRAGPSTGQPTKTGQQDVMQAKWGSHGDYEIIALAPSSVQEMFDLTVEAFNLSETYRCPVFLMTDELVGHLMERLAIPEPEMIGLVDRKKPSGRPSEYLPFRVTDSLVPEMATFGEGYRFYATGLTHDESGHPQTDAAEYQATLVKRICDKIRNNTKSINKVERIFLDDADICIVAYGSVARSALAATVEGRERGMKIGLLRPITIWPFPDEAVEEMASHVDKILVPEMNYGQLVREVERSAGRGKVVSLPKLGDALHTPEEILAQAVS
jgi:2-oxoglutarate/2-oxoacid ferredoxin oxidoreductase subunit alpha